MKIQCRQRAVASTTTRALVLLLLVFLHLQVVMCNVPSYRKTLVGECWTNVTCRRALITSHGGAWDLEYPYDSMGAMQRAYQLGTDSVKGDYRISKDGVGVVVHSSPLHWYESFNCAGKRVEDMTAAYITGHCRMALTKQHFMSVEQLLQWAQDKVIVMLDVKRDEDVSHAIDTIVHAGAGNRSFLELSPQVLLRQVPKNPRWRQAHYVANAHHVAQMQLMLNKTVAQWLQPNVFMFEFDPSLVSQVNLSDVVPRLHGAGYRTFTATRTQVDPSVKEQVGMFEEGIDVVYTYGTTHGVTARNAVDRKRGISAPP